MDPKAPKTRVTPVSPLTPTIIQPMSIDYSDEDFKKVDAFTQMNPVTTPVRSSANYFSNGPFVRVTTEAPENHRRICIYAYLKYGYEIKEVKLDTSNGYKLGVTANLPTEISLPTGPSIDMDTQVEERNVWSIFITPLEAHSDILQPGDLVEVEFNFNESSKPLDDVSQPKRGTKVIVP
jgi:hypothetical protein